MRSEGDDVQEINTSARFKSRADLEAAISEVSKQVNDAIAKKEFSKATECQAELDELEKLRSTLPSIEELESKLKEVKSMMDEAIKKKNFKIEEYTRILEEEVKPKFEELKHDKEVFEQFKSVEEEIDQV